MKLYEDLMKLYKILKNQSDFFFINFFKFVIQGTIFDQFKVASVKVL